MDSIDRILEIRKCINIIEFYDIDLSKIYNPDSKIESDQISYELQGDFMFLTRSVWRRWNRFYESDTEDILYLFKDVRNKFGTHPYHHPLDGRIADIVQKAIKERIKVPPEFMDDYYYFDFKPWNDPKLKSISIEELKILSSKEIHPEFRIN
ncbi:MAG: hypothetical protein AABW83_03600 [Nanoarchaeota archaeon]